MKVILPSSGVLGTRTVELRQPKYSDFRKASSLNQEELLLKTDFVKLLLPEDTDYKKITYQDMLYLYTIAIFSCNYQKITYQHTFSCKCGKTLRYECLFSDKEVIDLGKIKLPHHKSILGVDYEFNILSAEQHTLACEYALQEENFQNAYNDACAAFILGKTIKDIPEILDLDAMVYLAAHLFQRVMFHGVKLEEIVKCPTCGKEEIVVLDLDTSFINYDLNVFMSLYSNVSSLVDFDAFLDFTIPEYKAFIETFNAKQE